MSHIKSWKYSLQSLWNHLGRATRLYENTNENTAEIQVSQIGPYMATRSRVFWDPPRPLAHLHRQAVILHYAGMPEA